MDYTINYTTVNNECNGTASIQVSSSLFDAYLAALPTPDHTLKLSVAVCGGSTYTITVDDTNIVVDGAGNDYVLILPADLGMDTSIDDGIYDITLVKTITASGNETYEYSCVFVNCYTQCELQDYIADNWDYVLSGASGLHFVYDVLNNTSSCGDCNCTKVCEIWKKFQEILNNSNPTTDDCGCS